MAGVLRRVPGRAAAAALAAVVVAGLHVAYVVHYGADVAHYDDWSIVPMIDAARHGRLTFAALWAQHNESRGLVGNLVLVAFGLVDHYDTKAVIVLSALVMAAAFGGLLWLWRRRLDRWPHPVAVLVVGAVWFSLADFENALMAYQFMWMLVLALVVAQLAVFDRGRIGPGTLVAAAAVTVAASLTAFQGLLLWPLGLGVLWWRRRHVTRPVVAAGAWVAAAAVTLVLYGRGFSFSSAATGGGSVSAALRHPLGLLRYLLVLVGNVVPSENPSWIHPHEAIAVVVLGLAGWAAARSLLDARRAGRLPVAACLVAFAVAFDLSIALGRASLGVTSAQTSSRYTLPNVLLVVALSMVAADVATRRGRRRPRAPAVVVLAAAGALVVAQVAVSTNFGLTYGATSRFNAEVDARTVVNLDRLSPAAAGFLVPIFVINSVPALRQLRRMAVADRLNVFAPGVAAPYRRAGPPLELVPPSLRR